MASNNTRIPVPDRGMNRSVNPLATNAQRTFPQVTNLLPGYDRRAPCRGPIWDIYGGTQGSANSPTIAYNSAAEKLLQRDPSVAASGGFISHIVVNLVSNGATTLAVDSSRPIYNDPTMRAVTLRGVTYYIGGQPQTIAPAVYQNRYGQLPLGVFRWDGTAAPTGGTTGSFPSPGGPIDIIGHLDRVFQLGGADSSLAVDWGEKLFWTDVGGGLGGVIAEWQDDVSGLLNKIELGSAGGKLLKLGIVGRNLAILRQNAVQILYGDTPSSWALRTVLNNIGIVPGSQPLSFDDALIFLSNKGVMMFDGSSLNNISEPIDPILQRLVSRQATTTTTFARIDADHFMMTIVDTTFVTEGVSFICHVPTGSWFQFAAHSDLFGSTYGFGPRALYEVGSRGPMGWAGTKGYYLAHLTQPFLSDLTGTTWRIGRDKVDSGSNYRYIPWVAETPIQRLGSPMANGKLDRIGMYYTNRSSIAGDWSVNVGTREVQGEISNGATFGVGTYVGSTASTNTPYPNGPMELAIWDVMQEMRDCQVIVSGPTGSAVSTLDPLYMELGDIHLEWQPTRPR